MKKRLSSFWAVVLLLISCSPATKDFTSLTIGYVGQPRVALHQSMKLTAIAAPENASGEIVWTSSDPDVLSVNTDGLVTSMGLGSATIKVASLKNPLIESSLQMESYCVVNEVTEFAPSAPSYEALGDYHPTRFLENTWTETSSLPLADGATLNKVSLQLNNQRHVEMNVVEIELGKDVSIEAGSYMNLASATGKKQTLYGQMSAYEEDHPDREVLAITNADFFGNFPVNAFVKDNVIVRDAHLDNGGYDYTNTNNDIPASMPMLFGVTDGFAQVGAIVDNQDVQHTVQSKLSYTVHAIGKDGTLLESFENSQRNIFTSADVTRVNFISTTSRQAKAPANSTVYTLLPHEEGYETHGEVVAIQKVSSSIALEASSTHYTVIVPEALVNPDIALGDFFSYNIASEDGKWNHFQHILGARQELVHNGQVVPTVTLENTNGAQTTNIPRTAVGIMENGKVALVTIESMSYGQFEMDEDDSYGVSLPELAEMMRYYGVVNAGNFDGGGSTQLIVHHNGEDQVIVRSSDYGTYNLADGRNVVNSFLVTMAKN